MPIACGLLGLIAGGCLTVFLTNRWIFNFKESPARTLIHLTISLILTLGPFAAGWFIPSPFLLGTYLGLIALFGWAEARRLQLRRQMAAAPPVEHTRAPGSGRWNAPFTTTHLSIARYEVAVPGLSVPRLRIAHASDFHVSAELPDGYFARAMETIANQQPDLLLLTGDFISHTKDLPRLREVLKDAATSARLGTFAILGNHDYWSDADAVAKVLRDVGITRLYDQVARIAPAPGCVPLRLCGDERPWGPTPDWQPTGEVTIVLSHTPDNIYRQARKGAQLVLCGHNHAGQIRLPGWGAIIVPSVFGRRFDHGHFLVGQTHLFVTAGVGTGKPAFRVFCPPDIFVIDLVA
jgi:predicted MPP superfamily phosphohydrolase